MRQNMMREAEKYAKQVNRRRAWRKLVRVMACIVVFCTTYVLILPAITMEQDTFCGREEHTHTANCYTKQVQEVQLQPPSLLCDRIALGIHSHTEQCRNDQGELICGYADFVVHTHNKYCRNTAGELVCTLPEVELHTHTDECYQLQEKQPEAHTHGEECYEKQRGELTCTLEEIEGHAHSDDCYVPGGTLKCTLEETEGHTHGETCSETVLTCTLESEPHVHTDDCYQQLVCELPEDETHQHSDICTGKVLVCQLTEQPHVHDPAACYQTNLICDLPEQEPHSHGDDCYEQVLNCQLPEEEGHQHDDTCYEMEETLICQQEETGAVDPTEPAEPAQPELICEKTEIELHTHGEDCFTEIPETGEKQLICEKLEINAHDHVPGCMHTPIVEDPLTCTLTETEGHTHGDDCRDADGTLICQLTEEAAHKHDERCYGIWELSCGLEEHTHDVACYSDPTADVETPAQWEKTFSQVNITGIWSKDVISIAKTQLGYTESTKNYAVWEDGTIHGYTRYGEWYGSPTGDWCAMFVSFCLHYAGVEDMPLHWGCRLWIEELEKLDLYHPAAEYTPKSGDLIFFDWEQDGGSDHVGLVAQIIPATEGESAVIKTIEGNSSNAVRYVEYPLDDPRILGYSQLPENENVNYACGMQSHSHDTSCYDEAGSLTCQLAEHTHSASCVDRKIFYTDDQLRVFVTIRGVENLPEDLRLNVVPITRESDPDNHGAMQVALSEKMATKTQYVSDAIFYRMELYTGETRYELPEEAKVSVSMTFNKPVFTPKAVAESTDMSSFMLTSEHDESAQTTEDLDQTVTPDSSSTIVLEGVNPDDVYENNSEDASTEAPDGTIPAEDYEVAALNAADFENSEQGLTGISFETNALSTVAVALSSETQTGTFWTRVTTTAELASGGTFMIVSAEGNYALTGDEDNNYVPVTLQTVKGNTQYYTITNSDSTNVRWTFSGSGNSYTIRNQGTSNYIFMDSVRVSGSFWPRYEDYLLYSTSTNLTLSYITPENCWRIANGSDYLRNLGEGEYTYSSSSDGTHWTEVHYHSRDMLIFKLSDVTSLQIPPDVNNSSGDVGAPGVIPDKPTYDSFITPDGSKDGETKVTDENDESIFVKGNYYSDPSTTDIESEFRKPTAAEQEPNDGKVLTDKSVIYRSDDYGAFSSYEPNTFGVTMSALGQAYAMPQEDIVVTPVDVVFVLDVSGSMANPSAPGSLTSRATDLTAAVNTSIDQIMTQHPGNRVGIVLYSSGAWKMLPLDRYTADNGQYLTCVQESYTHQPTGASMSNVYHIKGGSSLKNEAGVSFAGAGSNAVQGIGTYTQAGIALGRETFHAIGDDTTYTTTIGEGEYERSYTVKRQPVFILLSDGEPTHSTSNYMDVLSGPHYGDGDGGTENDKGIHGYYTILSANYYKRMIGIHYQKPALFYTVGMGIKESGTDPMVDTSTNGDHYKRAILNPTVENITGLSGGKNAEVNTDILRKLMLSQYTEHTVDTRSEWPETWMGIPHVHVPVLQKNPYADNYSYADKAFFGNLTTSDLEGIFAEILQFSLKSVPYGFVLYQNSSVELTDYIGAGMEVKGVPVLRYGGQNYTNPEITVNGNTTTYRYSGVYVDPHIPNYEKDIYEIVVTVKTLSDGKQIVDMYVPDTVLPIYTPEATSKSFYYESLPVRLIYQVGLTEESEAKVLALRETGGKLTFYTNQWGEYDQAISSLIPSETNPFYNDVEANGYNAPYKPHQNLKTENTTETQDHVVECSKTIENWDNNILIKVIHRLGNNGKLVFEADAVKIPVEKKWDRVEAKDQVPVEVTLYKVMETTTESGTINRTVTKIATKTLSSENQWKDTFDGLQAPEENWYYAIVETHMDGFQIQYSGETVAISLENGKPVTAAKVDMSDPKNVLVSVTNLPALILPDTGGTGTTLYTMGGLMLIAAAGIPLLYNRKARRRKEDYSSS